MEGVETRQHSWWPMGLGLGSFAAFALFSIGYGYIDSYDPSPGPATVWYLATFVFGAAAIALAVVYRGDRHHWPLIAGGILALPVGFFTALLAQETYADWLFNFFFLAMVLPPLLVLLTLGLVVMGIVRGWRGVEEVSMACAVTVGGGMALAAMYHLMTLDVQVQRSMGAHESPGLGLLLVGVAVAAVTLTRRYSK